MFERKCMDDFVNRAILFACMLLVTFALSLSTTIAAEKPIIRIAVLKFGTVNWLLDSMKQNGFDEQFGFSLETIPLASKNATSVAFLSNSVDAFVTDWFWAMSERKHDKGVFFMPYSSSLGALVVSPESSINSLKDITGQSIGIAGGPLDKSWLIFQTLARQQGIDDLAKQIRPVYGAPPLLNAQAENRAVDGVLNYWHYAARLNAQGFRTVLSVGDAMNALGIDPAPPMVGFAYRHLEEGNTSNRWDKFASALAETIKLLNTSDEEWSRLRPLMKASDDKTFETLRNLYRAGIADLGSIQENTDAAQKLYEIMADVGGEKVVGSDPHFDPALFALPKE